MRELRALKEGKRGLVNAETPNYLEHSRQKPASSSGSGGATLKKGRETEERQVHKRKK